jgi:hypothetical protein
LTTGGWVRSDAAEAPRLKALPRAAQRGELRRRKVGRSMTLAIGSSLELEEDDSTEVEVRKHILMGWCG